MKTSIIIPIHSFCALITNSSSEVYIAVTGATISAAKNIVNNLLAISGAEGATKLVFDDLFTIEEVFEVSDDDGIEDLIKSAGFSGKGKWSSYLMTEKQVKALGKLIEEKEEEEPGFSDDLNFSVNDVLTGGDRYPRSQLSIQVKEGLSESNNTFAEKTARLLEGFVNTYSIESLRDG